MMKKTQINYYVGKKKTQHLNNLISGGSKNKILS